MDERKMTAAKATLTSGKIIRAFWEQNAIYVHDPPENGGRKSMCIAQLDNHLIIGTRSIDFCTKWLSHDLGTHKYCIQIQEEYRGKR